MAEQIDEVSSNGDGKILSSLGGGGKDETVENVAVSTSSDSHVGDKKSDEFQQVWCVTKERENYFQGVSFSPDGLCLLTATSDRSLQVWNLAASASPALTSVCFDTIRSYAWYPAMDSSLPATCCFVAAARNQPLHLFDAYTGAVRASYSPINRLDEMEAPSVVEFGSDTLLFAAGMRTDRVVHMFDITVPGRDATVLRLGNTRRSSDGQKGLVSAMTTTGDPPLLAVGTYAPGSIYLYDIRSGPVESGTLIEGRCLVGHGKGRKRKKQQDWIAGAKESWFRSRVAGGVTQLQFASHDTTTLFSVSRRSNAILQWDLRMMAGVASFATSNTTNQRLEFDVMDNCLYAGSLGQEILIYDLTTQKQVGTIDGLDDVANGVSCCNGERGHIAVACGSRQYPSEQDIENHKLPSSLSSLRLYKKV